MESSINTYSPQDVTLDIGNFVLQAWKSISIQKSTPGFRRVRGIRGKNTRSRNRDTSATITILVMQTSHTNDVLSQIHARDLQNGRGRMKILLKDASGSSVFHSNEAYIEDYPRAVYGDSISYHEWTIFCQSVDKHVVGGNSIPSTNLFDSLTAGVAGLLN